MKNFSVICVSLFFTLPIFASTFASDLNFTKLYNNFNAGSYSYTIQFTSNDRIVTTKLQESVGQDDGMFYCTSSVTFEIGRAVVTLKSNNSKWSETSEAPVRVELRSTVDGFDCDKSPRFEGRFQATAHLDLNRKSVALPVKAFKGYDSTQLWVSPNQFYVNVDVKKINDEYSLNSTGILSDIDSANPNFSTGYYVTGVKNATTLSLGVGQLPLKRLK